MGAILVVVLFAAWPAYANSSHINVRFLTYTRDFTRARQRHFFSLSFLKSHLKLTSWLLVVYFFSQAICFSLFGVYRVSNKTLTQVRERENFTSNEILHQTLANCTKRFNSKAEINQRILFRWLQMLFEVKLPNLSSRMRLKCQKVC